MQQWFKIEDAVSKNGVSQSILKEGGGMGKRLYRPKLKHGPHENLHGNVDMDEIECDIGIMFNIKGLIV